MPDAEVQRPVRTQLYWDLHDFSHGRGFELGPLFNPIVSRSEADVRYVDVFDTEQLRTSYTHDPNVDISKIVDVDVRLGRDDGSVATLSEALGPEAPFDWAMASHVVEHVPDLIGWLADVAAVVADGGVLVLAVPDKRYTFDIHRPLTTTGQLLEAHEAHVDRPGTRAVYDHRARLRARNGRLRVRVRQLKQRRARLRRKLRRRTRDLEAMRASTQWRVGGQVLRPIRWVRRDSTPGG